MGVHLRFGVFSVLAVVAAGATGLAVACGGDDGSGPAACTGADCDGGASSDSTTGSDSPSGTDGNTPPKDGGSDADADSSVVVSCGDGGAPGTLDESFGDGGLVFLPLVDGVGRAVVVQPDEKIVVVGASQVAAATALTIVRLMPNGSFDATFGTGGVARVNVGGAKPQLLKGVTLQPDGKILAVGYARPVVGDDFVVLRYLANGTPDATFGDGGVVITDFTSLDQANAVAVMPDARIVVAGSTAAGNADMAIARYNADGSLDTTFGGTGKVRVDVRGTADQAASLALLAGGKLVVAGASLDPNDANRVDMAAARLVDDGTLDPSFGSGGKFVASFGGTTQAFGVVLDSGGRVLLGGVYNSGVPDDFAVARLSSAGTTDPTWGDAGLVRTDFSARSDVAGSVHVQADGKIVVVGQSSVGAASDTTAIAISRYTSTASLDPTFGASGKALTLPAPNTRLGATDSALGECSIVTVGTWGYDVNTGLPKTAMGVARYRR